MYNFASDPIWISLYMREFFFISVGHRTQEEQNNKMEQKIKIKTTGVRKWWEEYQAFCCRMICVHYRPPGS